MTGRIPTCWSHPNSSMPMFGGTELGEGVFDNSMGAYRYSRPILGSGVEEALRQVSVDPERFLRRGGIYDW